MFAADLQALRPHPGQASSAANLRRLLADSGIMASHRHDKTHIVQDAYSLRCSPQVAGAARDALDFATGRGARTGVRHRQPCRHHRRTGRIERELPRRPIAQVLDFLAISTADVASISERRTDRMLDRTCSHGLPPFLAHGVDSAT